MPALWFIGSMMLLVNYVYQKYKVVNFTSKGIKADTELIELFISIIDIGIICHVIYALFMFSAAETFNPSNGS